jgi:AraC family transcriptional regulator of adaptative response / DNA-3-methyladenine glycosylase II
VHDLALPFTPPLRADSLFGHLAATAVPGVEEWRGGAYRRTLRLAHGSGTVTLWPPLDPGDGVVRARFHLADTRDLDEAVAGCRRLLDLDADPAAVDGALAADPVLAPCVATAPGRRLPRTHDAEELVIRAVLGQQVSTKAARTHAGRLAAAVGDPVADPEGGLTHLFPTPAAIAAVDPAVLRLPERRRRLLLDLAAAMAAGDLAVGPGADHERVLAQLLAMPGIGPWTTGIVAMRGFGDPDAFPAADLGVRVGAERLGLPGRPAALLARAEAWRPYRAYAVQHLWAAGDHEVNRLPG